jgi:hypothetical protein
MSEPEPELARDDEDLDFGARAGGGGGGGPPVPPILEKLDFDDGTGDRPPPVTPLRLFDAEPGRERVRAVVALVLVGLLTTMVLVTLIATIVDGGAGARLKSLLDTLLPPVVALCGSAIGFYYAGRPNH